jgi:hypothetical protein
MERMDGNSVRDGFSSIVIVQSVNLCPHGQTPGKICTSPQIIAEYHDARFDTTKRPFRPVPARYSASYQLQQ